MRLRAQDTARSGWFVTYSRRHAKKPWVLLTQGRLRPPPERLSHRFSKALGLDAASVDRLRI